MEGVCCCSFQLRSTVLRLSHDHPSSGHFSIDRTWSRLFAHYFWPNAKQDVTNWVQSCLACSVHNPSTKGYHTDPLQPIYSSQRFELVCYDLAGPFIPISSHGNIYALILVDHFTKWPEVLPLPDSKATTIASAIYDHWICRYGLMQRSHRDGAQNVDGCVIHELCLILRIGKSKSSRLHPQGDGLSKAMAKIVKSCVQKHADTTGKDWDLHLQSSVYAIRTSLTKGTGFSTAELIFGTSLKTPVEILATTDPKELQIPSQHHHQKQAQQFAFALGSQLQQPFTNV